MKVLKRKDTLTKTITVRVSPRLKSEFEEICERANAAGFDIGATLRDTIANTARKIRKELAAIDQKAATQSIETIVHRQGHANGISPTAKM
jgi:post-segregation antitoxin (ccd killing protein)